MKSIAVVFPGQGSQFVGMGSDLRKETIFSSKMRQVAEYLGLDLRELLQINTADTTIMQPYIYGISVALYELLQVNYNIEPILFAGHSLGEYAALTAAGSLSFEEGLKLVKKRSELMGEAPKGTMAAIIGMGSEELSNICHHVATETKGTVTIGNYNSSSQHVITGDVDSVETVSDYVIAEKKAWRVIPLNVSGAFHSDLMTKANHSFQQVLSNATLNAPTSTIIMNANGSVEVEPGKIYEQLSLQMISPVLWDKSVASILSHQPSLIIEVGPGRTLTGLIKSINRSQQVINVGNKQQLLQFAKYWRRLEFV